MSILPLYARNTAFPPTFSIQNAPPAVSFPPSFVPNVQRNGGYAVVSNHSDVLPDSQTIRARLSSPKAILTGMKSGLLFSGLASVPIWGIERIFKKKNYISEMLSAAAFPKAAKFLSHDGVNVLTSVAGSTALGVLLGGTLGWMTVQHVKQKLLEINKVRQEQQQGIFKPHSANFFQRLSFQKPVNNPDQAIQEVLHKDLDPNHAFWQGVKNTFLIKIVGGVVIPTCLLTAIFTIIGFTRGKRGVQQIENLSPFLNHKAMLQPVFVAKLILIPFLGGFIAQRTAPWIKAQLGNQ